MLGRKERDQLELFITGSLRQLVPDDHILVRVDRNLDLAWLRGEVADVYCCDNGRPGIDPEVAVRLMLAGLLLGIVHDRRLMREAQVNLAIRWFIGYGLHETLPDHSSLTRIRQRWGAERFKAILTRSAQACVAATIATGEVVHIDASLIRADVTWDALVAAHADQVEAAHQDRPDQESNASPPPASGRSGTGRRFCRTDPDASLAKGRKNRPAEPSYKQHTALDGGCGVILDVMVTTGAAHDTTTVEAQLEAVAALTGVPIQVATMDAGYAITRVFADLEARKIEAVVPAKAERPPRPGVIPVRRFKLDAKHNRVRCPRGRILKPHGKPDADGFQHDRAQVRDCAPCPLRASCFSARMKRRAILLHKDHPALIRARRKRLRWGARERRLYASHRSRIEGFHGEAKTWHGLARAVRRGLENMKIQAYLTAAAINLKRLAAALLLAFITIVAGSRRDRPSPLALT
jgi:IS5 family transposase